MTVALFPSAHPPAPKHTGLDRLKRLEETLEASLAACESDEEMVRETALAKAVSSVAFLAGAEDPRLEVPVARAIEQAYDVCLAGLADAYAGDHAALASALSAVHSIRVSILREHHTRSKPPRAA